MIGFSADSSNPEGLRALFVSLGFALLAIGCASSSDVEVVDSVDVESYLGTWYEAASFPIRAQRGCVGTTAEYSMREDGDIKVYNRCLDGGFEGEVKDIEAKAWVVDEQTNAKLKVQFFWPFRSDYWIVGLDEDYQWAVVSGPDRDNLWILSREPCMADETVQPILKDLMRRGFDLSRLEATPQQNARGQTCEIDLGNYRDS